MGKRKRPKPYRNGSVVLGRRDGCWVADIRDEVTGKRLKRIRLKATTEEQAKREIDFYADAQRAVKKQKAQHTVGDLWSLWLKDRERDKLSNDIYDANWVSLKPAFGNRNPDLLTKDDWRTYAEDRFAIGRSSWTVHTELSRLKACLKWAVQNRHLTAMPIYWLPQRGEHRNRVLTFDEAQRLLDAAAEHSDPHIYLFILLAITTAARHTAILDLEWDRVDFDAGTIQYDENKPVDPMSKSWRKGRATVPMGPRLRAELLSAYQARQTKHVIEHGGRRLKTVREGFRAAVERAGIGQYVPHPTKRDQRVFETDVTPHTLRHTVSTWLKEKGVGLEYRAQLLGHADSRMTDVGYSHAKPAYLSTTVEILDAALPQTTSSGRVAGGRRKAVSSDLVPVGQTEDFNSDAGEAPK